MPGAQGFTLTGLRLALHRNGYRPVPVSDPNPVLSSGGKAPLLKNWRSVAAAADETTIAAWSDTVRNHGNTGLLCGDLVGLDLDTPDPELARQVGALADAMLPPTPLHRIGKAPKALRCYRAAAPMAKMETPELLLDDGSTVQVEALGAGQQFVGFGTHPGTGRGYDWPHASPLTVSLADLPVVEEAALRSFLGAAEAVLRAAGGRTKAEREKDAAPAPEPTTAPAAVAKPSRGKGDTDTFFAKVNKAALARIEPWFRAVFPTAAQEEVTKAWRVKSGDIGRGLEEDLSIHPEKGGHDWGTRRSCSPIDVVMEWGGAPKPMEAALWLCEKLNTDPATLGWTPPREKKERPKADTSTPDSEHVLLTEHGVAVAFRERFKDRLRYCHDTGAWFEWTGTHWRQDRKHAAFSFARELVAEANREAEFKTQAITGKAAFAGGVEKFAQRDPVFAVTSEVWDPDPFLLGTPGGVVDLRTGTLRPAQPGDLITKLTAVAPAESPHHPVWDRFLMQATGGDLELIRFLRQWYGYSLTGDTREHALLFNFGPGGNGKGVLLNTVSGILGAYACTAAMDTFMASHGDRHPTDLAMLRGARLVTASETEEGRQWAEARIKQLTGGDPVSARFMRQDFFEFRPAFKLSFAGNHRPVLRNVDEAVRRRFNLMPFLHKPAVKDTQLEEKLKAEWPAILRWMIEGCLDWLKHGLVRPPVVTLATSEYFTEQDTMAQWIEDACHVGPGLGDTHSSLWGSWSSYARNRGEEPGGAKGFSQALYKRGFKAIKNSHGIRGRGIGGLKVQFYIAQGEAA